MHNALIFVYVFFCEDLVCMDLKADQTDLEPIRLVFESNGHQIQIVPFIQIIEIDLLHKVMNLPA